MNLAKAKKRIAKKIKMGNHGFPELSIEYLSVDGEPAREVVLCLVVEEGAESMQERLPSKNDARENEVIQSAIVKMIERTGANTVTLLQ
jgi:hypothetical protein